MKRMYGLTLIFAVLFAVLFVAPAFLGSPFGPYPLMEMGDVLDLLILFFTIAYLVATLFVVGWGIYWGGWPEFSEVGII